MHHHCLGYMLYNVLPKSQSMVASYNRYLTYKQDLTYKQFSTFADLYLFTHLT